MEPHATRRAALRADLGLSIVRSITAAHSGTVRARPRPAGGLIVEIDLPPAPSLPASTDLIADRGDTPSAAKPIQNTVICASGHPVDARCLPAPSRRSAQTYAYERKDERSLSVTPRSPRGRLVRANVAHRRCAVGLSLAISSRRHRQ